MKKTILALTIPAMLAVSAAATAANVYKTDSQTLDVFGRGKFSVNRNHDSQTRSDFSARFGVKGTTQISEGLSAFAHVAWDMQSQRDQLSSNVAGNDDLMSREVFVGLDYGQAGSLELGQDHTPFYSSLTKVTDIFDWDGQESYVGTYGKNFNPNQAIYTNAFGPVTVQASYQFDTQQGSGAAAIDTFNGGVGTFTDQSNAHSLAVVYDTGLGLNVRAAYARQNFAGDEHKNNYGFGVDYTMDNLYVAALYTHDKEDGVNQSAKRNGYEFAAKYNMGKISLLTGYAYGKQDSDATGNDSKYAKAFKLGMQYHFTSNVKGMVQWTNNTADQIDNSNAYHAGLQYNF
ncbi:porin [Celerinatantimonas yamalensis]|uniref:Porin n=1 Tax=Celerinatantimonas yamalensis TaxID=559956 RepID=A0ABW9G3K8_9GAMM